MEESEASSASSAVSSGTASRDAAAAASAKAKSVGKEAIGTEILGTRRETRPPPARRASGCEPRAPAVGEAPEHQPKGAGERVKPCKFDILCAIYYFRFA
ncbi:hypothetical protein Bpla01_61240 [Burkholderia plantarii]|nr:hypothetical protein Bpla01_61240 [Burkholderia plantarii]